MVETLLEEVREHVAESSKHIEQAKSVVHDACEDLRSEVTSASVKGGRTPLRISRTMPDTRSRDIPSQRWPVAS